MRPRCWIDERALAQLVRERRRFTLRETGGALLGWRDGNDAVVAFVLGPGPKAQHRLSSFEPDGPWQAYQGTRIYEATDRLVAYIGDWHSHPRGGLRPSGQDRVAAQQIASDPDFRAPRPLSAIAGRTSRFGCRLAVYSWIKDEFKALDVLSCRLDPTLFTRAGEAIR